MSNISGICRLYEYHCTITNKIVMNYTLTINSIKQKQKQTQKQ